MTGQPVPAVQRFFLRDPFLTVDICGAGVYHFSGAYAMDVLLPNL